MNNQNFAAVASAVAVLSFCLSTSGAAAARSQMLQTLQNTAMDTSDGSRLAHAQRKLLQVGTTNVLCCLLYCWMAALPPNLAYLPWPT